MISKIIMAGKSAVKAEAIYVLKDEKQATILATNGVRPDFLAEDFMFYTDLQPLRSKNLILHNILSFPHEERNISEELATRIAKEYLENLGFGNSGYCLIAHRNREHFHIHCLASTVDLQGNNIDLSFIGLRGKKCSVALTQKYNLIPATRKNFSKSNFSSFRKNDPEKYRLYTNIDIAVKNSRSMNQFEQLLKNKEIEIKYKYKLGTEEIQGISFRAQNLSFRGSEIDRQFSYNKIVQQINSNIPHAINQSQLIQPQQEKANSTVSDFLSLFGGLGSSNSTGIYPTHAPTNLNNDDEDDKKKKKKKRRNNNLSI